MSIQRVALGVKVDARAAECSVVDLAVNVLCIEHELIAPAFDQVFDVVRQEDLALCLVPGRLGDEGEHDAGHVGQVGHAGVPESEVADDEAALFGAGLDRWGVLASRLDYFWLDGELFFVVFTAGDVRVLHADVVGAGPDLGSAVFGGCVDEGDVDDVGKGEEGWVGEFTVGVDGLSSVGAGFEGCIAVGVVDDGLGAKDGGEDGGGERVAPDVFEH